MSSQKQTVRFREEDLALFSRASGDCNPLHMSPQYAARTPYGQRVVFGALGALACLGSLEPLNSRRTKRLVADFHRPMFLDIDYGITVTERADGYLVRLLDGTVPLLTLTARFADESYDVESSASLDPHFERTTAAGRGLADISSGCRVTGAYRADGALLVDLSSKWNVKDTTAAEILLWSSYLVGMELPGRDALFFRVALDFDAHELDASPVSFVAEVQNVNVALSQLRMRVDLTSGHGRPVAHGQITSFIRSEIAADLSGAIDLGPPSRALDGRVAVVIGASRGLGAAITRVFVTRGAQVVAVSRSQAEFTGTMPDEAYTRIESEQGDATDPAWLSQLRTRVLAKYGRLDFLVCSAFPAIPALRLELAAWERLQNYVTNSTAMVTAPLCAFLDTLHENSGCVVLISSMAVEKAVREWPHYVAAKHAVEGYAKVIPLQYPQARVLIVRPEKLLTEMVNTPMGRHNASSPLDVAVQICNRLEHLSLPGGVEYLCPKTHSRVDNLPGHSEEVLSARSCPS